MNTPSLNLQSFFGIHRSYGSVGITKYHHLTLTTSFLARVIEQLNTSVKIGYVYKLRLLENDIERFVSDSPYDRNVYQDTEKNEWIAYAKWKDTSDSVYSFNKVEVYAIFNQTEWKIAEVELPSPVEKHADEIMDYTFEVHLRYSYNGYHVESEYAQKVAQELANLVTQAVKKIVKVSLYDPSDVFIKDLTEEVGRMVESGTEDDNPYYHIKVTYRDTSTDEYTVGRVDVVTEDNVVVLKEYLGTYVTKPSDESLDVEAVIRCLRITPS